MIIWVIILAIVVLVLAIALGVSVHYNVKFGAIIIEMEDAVDQSLAIFDQTYGALSDVLDTPVLVDSPEVRNAVYHIKKSRDAVLFVANALTEQFGDIVEEEEDGSSEET